MIMTAECRGLSNYIAIMKTLKLPQILPKVWRITKLIVAVVILHNLSETMYKLLISTAYIHVG